MQTVWFRRVGELMVQEKKLIAGQKPRKGRGGWGTLFSWREGLIAGISSIRGGRKWPPYSWVSRTDIEKEGKSLGEIRYENCCEE